MTILVTGGCGFIGSALIRRLMADGERIVNVDKLTYAATEDSLHEFADDPRYRLIRGDICDPILMQQVFEESAPDALVHCAAESHVDRSIDGPAAFLHTNVTGTFTLLEAARTWWQGRRDRFRFHHISTDEVYGSLGPRDLAFTEKTAYQPNSPYSASKAASDHLVRAWGETYGLPVMTSNCSNNFGPWQFPEKLIPLMIINALEGRTLPVYGSGDNVRDWVHVDDHADAVVAVLRRGTPGEVYNIGGRSEMRNLEVVHLICAELDRRLPEGAPHSRLIRHVADRAGHDRRYAVDATKIHAELGWKPSTGFLEGLEDTVGWYLANRDWWTRIRENRYGGQRLGLGSSTIPAVPREKVAALT